MKLYFSPGACSLAAHITCCEADHRVDLEKVSLADKKTASGNDYRAINPKGYVPALQLDSGEVLTEVAAVLQYLADKAPAKQLAPAAGSMERYRLMEWLNFTGTELHKNFGPLFKQTASDDMKQAARDTLALRLEVVAKHMADKAYLVGNQFTVADAYLFTVLNWGRIVKFDLGRWPALQSYLERIGARPAVQQAMVEEGLIKA
jgi:glutathione S-transferase